MEKIEVGSNTIRSMVGSSWFSISQTRDSGRGHLIRLRHLLPIRCGEGIPFGGSPTGAGESPAPPFTDFQRSTDSKMPFTALNVGAT
ncbi:MAG: hypothetical protein V9H26_03360 [Verrucomicrobiota bacterium]